MKSAARKTAPNQPLEKKPQRRWLKRVVSVLDEWSTQGTELTLVYGPTGYSTRNFGHLGKVSDKWYTFHDNAGGHVSLIPIYWDSAKIDKGDVLYKEAIWIRAAADGNDFSLTDSELVRPSKPEPVNLTAVYDQFRQWRAAGQSTVHVVFGYGMYATVTRCSLVESNPDSFVLFDEIHSDKSYFLTLGNCERVECKRTEKSCAITLISGTTYMQISPFELSPEVLLAFHDPTKAPIH
jgi:hypothetical protein